MVKNWDIIGHGKEVGQLCLDIETGKMSHAYIFAGPSGVGKFTVAKKMAKVLQCADGGCGECAECVQVDAGSHVDTSELHDDGSIIGIDYIKRLTERLNMTPQSRYKVFILKNIERMNREAANCFLKILEEPPKQTLIVLTTSNLGNILPTLISRSRVVNFSACEDSVLRGALEKRFEGADVEKACEIANGRPGKGIELLTNEGALDEYLAMENKLEGYLNDDDLFDKFSFVESLIAEKEGKGVRAEMFLNVLTNMIRKKMLEEITAEGREEQVKRLSKIAEAGILLRQNVNLRLLLENLLISL